MSLYHYRTGRGAPVMLLHGWGMNAAVWEPLLPELAELFSVTVVELPGHGESPAAIAADLAEWARLCLSVAPARAHWVGWSLGGQVALRAALDAPARVGGVSLLAATPRFVQASDWPLAMPVDSFHQFADALVDDPNATLLRFLSLQVKGDEHARDTLKMLRAELAQRAPASRKGLAQGLELLLHTDLRAELRHIACQTLWLFGSRDTLVPSGVRRRILELLPGARIEVIDGAGHAPFLSHPQAGLDALVRAVAGPSLK
jgi:pimeloyl-[acyl-carrier protein] methyl ester esterase